MYCVGTHLILFNILYGTKQFMGPAYFDVDDRCTMRPVDKKEKNIALVIDNIVTISPNDKCPKYAVRVCVPYIDSFEKKA